jgi:hypothetical protein
VSLVGFLVPSILVDVQVDAGRGQRRMPEDVPHVPQVHLMVGKSGD